MSPAAFLIAAAFETELWPHRVGRVVVRRGVRSRERGRKEESIVIGELLYSRSVVKEYQ